MSIKLFCTREDLFSVIHSLEKKTAFTKAIIASRNRKFSITDNDVMRQILNDIEQEYTVAIFEPPLLDIVSQLDGYPIDFEIGKNIVSFRFGRAFENVAEASHILATSSHSDFGKKIINSSRSILKKSFNQGVGWKNLNGLIDGESRHLKSIYWSNNLMKKNKKWVDIIGTPDLSFDTDLWLAPIIKE